MRKITLAGEPYELALQTRWTAIPADEAVGGGGIAELAVRLTLPIEQEKLL